MILSFGFEQAFRTPVPKALMESQRGSKGDSPTEEQLLESNRNQRVGMLMCPVVAALGGRMLV